MSNGADTGPGGGPIGLGPGLLQFPQTPEDWAVFAGNIIGAFFGVPFLGSFLDSLITFFLGLFSGVPRDAKTAGTAFGMLHEPEAIAIYLGKEVTDGVKHDRVLSESGPPGQAFGQLLSCLGYSLIKLSNHDPSGGTWHIGPGGDNQLGPYPPPPGAPYDQPTGPLPFFRSQYLSAAAYTVQNGFPPPTDLQMAQFLYSGLAPTWETTPVFDLVAQFAAAVAAYKQWLGPQTPPPPPPPPGECADPCLQQIIVAVTNLVGAVSSSAAPIDSLFIALNPLIATLTAALPNILAVLESPAPAEAAAALKDLAECVCPKLDELRKTIANADQRDVANKALLDHLVADGVLDPEEGQLLGDPARVRIDPTRVPKWTRDLFKPGAEERALSVFKHQRWIAELLLKLLAFSESEAEGIFHKLSRLLHKWTPLIASKAPALFAELASIETTAPKAVFDKVVAAATGGAGVTPDNVEDVGFKLFGGAFIVGQALHLLGALASYLGYPMSSIWGNNAALMVDLLAFDEIRAALHGSFFRAALGEPARQKYNKDFRPAIPPAAIAAQWFARGLIAEPEIEALLALNGLRPDLAAPQKKAGARPVSAFIADRLAAQGAMSEDDLRAILTFNGIRPADQGVLIDAFGLVTLQSDAKAYTDKSIVAAGNGAISLEELDGNLREARWSEQKRSFAAKEALVARQIALATEVERSALDQLKSGALTPDQARSLMQAAGVQSWRVETTVALGSAVAAEALARKIEAREISDARQTLRLTQRALGAQFLGGTIGLAALTAALAASSDAFVLVLQTLGATPTELAAEVLAQSAENAATVVSLEAQLRGHQTLLFGVSLSRDDAELLRARVDELKTAVLRADIDPGSALVSLVNLGLSEDQARALVDRWTLQLQQKGSQPLGPSRPQF